MLSTPADFPSSNCTTTSASLRVMAWSFSVSFWGQFSTDGSPLTLPDCTAQSSIMSIGSVFFVFLWGIFLNNFGYSSHQAPLWQGPQCSTFQRQHRRLVPNNSWSPKRVSNITHHLQHISGKDHDRCLRRSRSLRQHLEAKQSPSPICWWHRWLGGRGRRTGTISWASLYSLHCLWHGNPCREDQVDDKQHQRHQQGD